MNNMNKSLMAILMGLLPALSFGVDDCAEQARSAMEKAYCQVVAAGFADGLPTLNEFRKNPEKTQRLLLRRHAQRAGVILPEERKSIAAAAVTQAPAEAPKSVAKALPDSDDIPCRVEGDVVICAGQRYQLIGNQGNGQLSPTALTSATQLNLGAFTGDPEDQRALMHYLDESYQQYIEAMIAIGLAASTMSFTKYYHTFIEVRASGANFPERMATMFEYLKKDKQSMAVPEHFTSQRPANINQCRKLNSTTVVCDDVKHNWIYRLNY